MTPRSQASWRLSDDPRCRGCGEPTDGRLYDEEARPVPVCADCAELSAQRPGLRRLILACWDSPPPPREWVS